MAAERALVQLNPETPPFSTVQDCLGVVVKAIAK
jgi:hypothetical protein